jgi:hypothetical protein
MTAVRRRSMPKISSGVLSPDSSVQRWNFSRSHAAWPTGLSIIA